jgi:uncharacterized protein (TIGR02466 family)
MTDSGNTTITSGANSDFSGLALVAWCVCAIGKKIFMDDSKPNTRSRGRSNSKPPPLASNKWWFYAFLCSLLLNMALTVSFVHYRHILKELSVSDVPTLSSDTANPCTHINNSFHIINKEITEGYSSWENGLRSDQALNIATTFTGDSGQGQLGWLWLLAAVDLSRRNMQAIYNLVSNYEELYAGFSGLAYSELMSSKNALSVREMATIMPASKILQHQTQFQAAEASIQSVDKRLFPLPCTTHAFTTMFTTYDMSTQVEAQMNEQLYAASVSAYEQLKASNPQLSSTDLNHMFFKFQMNNLDTDSNSYWKAFAEAVGFKELVKKMRYGAFKFLMEHGFDETTALRKASHPVIIWVSVHDQESVHQPHVTNDALVGGVYYVHVPSYAGRLQLFDPRGKGPIGEGLRVPTSVPLPPFHREMSIRPRESKLVLFPGWLVHSVMPATSSKNQSFIDVDTSVNHVDVKDYRVSLSLNLKGEWQDTAALHIQRQECVP